MGKFRFKISIFSLILWISTLIFISLCRGRFQLKLLFTNSSLVHGKTTLFGLSRTSVYLSRLRKDGRHTPILKVQTEPVGRFLPYSLSLVLIGPFSSHDHNKASHWFKLQPENFEDAKMTSEYCSAPIGDREGSTVY